MRLLISFTLHYLKILTSIKIYLPYYYSLFQTLNLLKYLSQSSLSLFKSCHLKLKLTYETLCNNKNNNINSGFTLIELLIVFIILGGSVGIGAHRWQQFQLNYELTTNMQRMLLFLSNIQTQANWDNKTYSILLINNSHSACLIATTLPTSADKNCLPISSSNTNINSIFELSNPSIKFKSITPSELAFYGVRNTAKAGNIILENELGSLRLILSVRGRLRVCSESKEITNFPPC